MLNTSMTVLWWAITQDDRSTKQSEVLTCSLRLLMPSEKPLFCPTLRCKAVRLLLDSLLTLKAVTLKAPMSSKLSHLEQRPYLLGESISGGYGSTVNLEFDMS